MACLLDDLNIKRITLLLVGFAFLPSYGQECTKTVALGLSSGYIENRQITASSFYKDETYGPSQARLDIYSSWCGNKGGQEGWKSEWLQVDFLGTVRLTGVGLQGNRRSAESSLFVTSFYLQVSNSSDSLSFRNVTDEKGDLEVFIGVENNKDAAFRWLKQPTTASFVRFRPLTLNDGALSSTRACARLEFYGCGHNSGLSECKTLFPLGMHNEIIADAQLSASSQKYSTTDPAKARFNRLGRLGWCPLTTSQSEWIRIDMGFPAVITAFAVQGDGYGDYVARYFVYESNTTSNFTVVSHKNGTAKDFFGNIKNTFQDPAMAILNPPLFARYVQISPQQRGITAKENCMRVEVFGYHQAGQDEILLYDQATYSEGTADSQLNIIHRPPLLSLPMAHCISIRNNDTYAKPSAPIHFLEVKLSKPRPITGIGLQGDSLSGSWITSFKLAFQWLNGSWTTDSKTYTGNIDQMDIGRHWFFNAKVVVSLRLFPLSWQKKPCLKLQLYGIFDGGTFDVQEGQLASFRCAARTCPKVEVAWFVNNTHQIGESETLYLPDVNRTSTGSYHCNATGLDLTSLSPPIYLNVMYIDEPNVDGPAKLYVAENDPVRVLCTAVGNPPTNISWFSDQNQYSSRSPLLFFQNASRSAAGQYLCIAENRAGSKQKTVTLTVYYLDTPYTSENVTIRVTEFGSVSVICKANGIPRPYLKWTVPNAPLIITSGGILNVVNVNRSNGGYIQCKASNKFGTKGISIRLEVLYLDKPQLNVSSLVHVHEGSSLTVMCNVTSFPATKVKWINSSNKTADKGPLLNLFNITRDLSQSFTCVGENNAIGTTKTSFFLDVYYLDLPWTAVKKSVLEILEFSTVNIFCSAKGRPTPLIVWKLANGTHISASNGTVQLNNITRINNGSIYCEAQNIVGITRSSLILSVIYLDYPKLNITKASSVIEDSHIVVLCTAESNPEPQFYWTDDDNNAIHFGPLLNLRSVKRNASNIYTCMAKNSVIGTKNSTFKINVQYIDTPTLSSRTNMVKEMASINISCSAAGKPPPSIYWLLPQGTQVPSPEGTIQLLRVKREAYGQLHCIANNSAGQTSNYLDLKVAYVDFPTLNVSEYHAITEGNALIVFCKTQSYPSASFAWYDEDKKQVSYGPFLRFENVNRDLLKSYTCEANNTIMGTRKKTFFLSVQYLDRPKINASEIITVKEGYALRLHCSVVSSPVANLYWIEYDNLTITYGPDLLLRNVSRYRAGHHSCVASNEYIGTKSSAILLQIAYMNDIALNTSWTTIVEEGGSLAVDCHSDAFPKETVTWRAPSGKTISYESILYLQRVRQNMTGLYECLKKNGYYQRNRSFYLTVEYINCTANECQLGGSCVKRNGIEKCYCAEGHYSRYCGKMAKGLLTRLFFGVYNQRSQSKLRREDLQQLVGESSSISYKTFVAEIKLEIDRILGNASRLSKFMINTRIKNVSISSVDLLLSIYLAEEFNSSLGEVARSINESFSFSGFSLRLRIHPDLQYQLDTSKLKVEDLDECKFGTHQCETNYTCQNVKYSYRCVCKEGYISGNNSCMQGKVTAIEDTRNLQPILISIGVSIVFLLLGSYTVHKYNNRKIREEGSTKSVYHGHCELTTVERWPGAQLAMEKNKTSKPFADVTDGRVFKNAETYQ